MADNQEQIIKALECCTVNHASADCEHCAYEMASANCMVALMKDALTLIKETPVVRCKDCEWWTKQSDSAQGRCGLLGIYPTGARFCGNGKRAEK